MIEFRLYTCPKYRKCVKFISNLTKYINTYKNLITLPSCQFLNSTTILKYNTTSYPNFLLNKTKENTGSEALNDSKKKLD